MSDETPSEDAPNATPTDSPASVDVPTDEAPTAVNPAVGVAAPGSVDAGFAAAPAPPLYAGVPAPPAKSTHFLVPKWLGLVVAGVVLAGAGFGIGWAVAPRHHNSVERIATGPRGGFGLGSGGGNPALPYGGGPGSAFGNGSSGTVTPSTGAYLGVVTQSASSGSGAQVVRVANGSPADGAGLKADDVITKVNDTSVSSPQDLVQAVESHKAGDQVTITYTRGGTSATATVKLGDRSTTTTQN